MRVIGVIQLTKTNVSFSAWNDDKLKSKDFPLSKKKGRAYPLTRSYRWQIISFSAKERNYRVLVAYHTMLPEFITTLGEEVGGDMRVLARWEFHGTHGGWHVHTVCGETDDLAVGIVKQLQTRRIPDATSYHRHMKMLNDGHVMGDAVATAIACSLVEVAQQPDMFVIDAMPWA